MDIPIPNGQKVAGFPGTFYEASQGLLSCTALFPIEPTSTSAHSTDTKGNSLDPGYKRNYPVLTSSISAYEASVAGLLNSARQYLPARVKLSLFLIVHHKGSFRPMQHKVVWRLLLTVVYRSPFLIFLWQGRPVGSLDLRTLTQFSKSLPSFVQQLFLVQRNKSRHTRPAGSGSVGGTCCMFSFPLILASLVKASLRKPPALLV